VSLLAITVVVAFAFPGLYTSTEEIQGIAETMRNPAMDAMLGPGYGLDNYHYGAIMAHQMLLFSALAVAIMTIMLVVKHTRRDEEDGRIEMITSLPVGRLSNLGSTMIVATGASMLLALLVAVGLGVTGLEGMDWHGSILYGVVLGLTGILFAAITAVFVQLAETSRGASTLAFGFLGLSYLLRAIGDVSSEALSLISPLGLVLRTQVYVNNYWWPVIVGLLLSAALTALALYLNSIRDLEAGFIPAKPGRRNATALLQTPVGLLLRLQKTAIISWAAGMFLLGLSYGSVLGDIEMFFSTSEMIQLMLPAMEGVTLTEQFVAMLMVVMSMIGTVPALLVVLKLRAEEKAGRTEHILARSVSRGSLMANHLGLAIVVAVVMQLLSVAGLWLASSAVMDVPIGFGTMLGAALTYMPAILVILGLGTLLIGLWPERVVFSWLYLGYSFFVVYLGSLLRFPEWLQKLSPFGHVPNVPVADPSVAVTIITLTVAGILIVTGFKIFKIFLRHKICRPVYQV